MTREGLLKHWAVVEAYRNGKQVQYWGVSGGLPAGWVDTVDPKFNVLVEYRIKPEKKRVWINFYKEDRHLHFSRLEADTSAGSDRVACIEIEYEEGQGL